MKVFKDRIKKYADGIDKKTEEIFFFHPFLAFLTAFVGLPVITLGAVILFTVIVLAPVSAIFYF